MRAIPKGFEGLISQSEWNAAQERYDGSPYKAEAIRSFFKSFAEKRIKEPDRGKRVSKRPT